MFITLDFLSDHYQKIMPGTINLPHLRGFGYSFSNVMSRPDGMPYFAVGSVNDDYAVSNRDSNDVNRNADDKVILFDFFCINLKCKSTVESPDTIKKEEGEFRINYLKFIKLRLTYQRYPLFLG